MFFRAASRNDPGPFDFVHTTYRHCNTLQCVAVCETTPLSDFVGAKNSHFNTLQYTAAHCNTLQHTATHCSTLQHTTRHCNTLHHTAIHCSVRNNLSFWLCPRQKQVVSMLAAKMPTLWMCVFWLVHNTGIFFHSFPRNLDSWAALIPA